MLMLLLHSRLPDLRFACIPSGVVCERRRNRLHGCSAAGWVGLKTLVAGLTKNKGEGDIPSHVDDLRCLSLVFSGNSAVGILMSTCRRHARHLPCCLLSI